jgi:hypothetical protein
MRAGQGRDAPPRERGRVRECRDASGTVADVAVLREYTALCALPILATSANWRYFRPLVACGDEVVGPADASDFPTWLAGFMLHAPTAREAIAQAQEVNDGIVKRVRIAPLPACP